MGGVVKNKMCDCETEKRSEGARAEIPSRGARKQLREGCSEA